MTIRSEGPAPRVSVFPMHGYRKMLVEGFRTRDAHLLEWFRKKLPDDVGIDVYSRPDPSLLRLAQLRTRPLNEPIKGVVDHEKYVHRLPNPRNRKGWWLSAANHLDLPLASSFSVSWIPTLALAPWFKDGRVRLGHLHFDLLDDWTKHHAFVSIRLELEAAYDLMFRYADSVSANSEGTLELARRFGRNDCALLPNGCDPHRFTQESRVTGPRVVGYLGKIGIRLDIELIENVSRAFPSWRFVFAGPVLEREVGARLTRLANVEMIGDVNYAHVPDLLTTFDVGWVPHGVEQGQVGGDAIKIYEYRAAGLPVVTTPIIGTRERPMDGVEVVNAESQIEFFAQHFGEQDRVPRDLAEIPESMTWESKAEAILSVAEDGQ